MEGVVDPLGERLADAGDAGDVFGAGARELLESAELLEQELAPARADAGYRFERRGTPGLRPALAFGRPSERLPVLLFIHGGSNISGYSADPIYDGARLAQHANAVVVTINYRLGPLGYFAHPLLDACTSYGTHLWLPFSREPAAWNLVAVFDPAFTLLLAVPLWLFLRRADPPVRRR